MPDPDLDPQVKDVWTFRLAMAATVLAALLVMIFFDSIQQPLP